MKGEARRTHVREVIAKSKSELERSAGRDLAIREKGTEALEGWIKERWRQAVHAGSNRPTDPDPVSDHLASCYRDIRYSKGRIVAGEQAFADMGRGTHPLLHWQD
jgi:hypothetical protein